MITLTQATSARRGLALATAGLAALALASCASTGIGSGDAPLASAAAPASDALYAPAASLGLDTAALATLDAALASLAADQTRAGYVAMVGRGDKIGHVSVVGARDLASGAPMEADTRFRIASMTKAVTAVTALSLVEDGLLKLDDPVSKYIPAFADPQVVVSPMADADGKIATRAANGPITVEHVLTHTSGVGYIFDPQTDLGQRYIGATLYAGEGDLSSKMDQLAQMPLYFDPGERWFYSYAQDILGLVIERAAGAPFEDVMQERVLDPLAMTSTTFFPDAAAEAALATLYTHHPEYGIVPAFSEEYPEYRPTWPSGGGGLVSTAEDYMRFGMMLLNGGALGEARVLKPETVALMATPHVGPDRLPERMDGYGYGYGIGVVIPPQDEANAKGVPGDVAWGGAFDTDFFASPALGLVAVLMTQELPGAEGQHGGNSAAIFRPLVYATVPAPAQAAAAE